MGRADAGAPLALARSLPPAPGVYQFRDQRASVLYIGRAVNLRRRVASYWGGLSSRGHLAPMVSRIARVQALVCDSEHEAAWLERNLLERELPRWNRSAGGQEVPVYIRLDLRPRSAGLKVVPDARPAPAARYFGPYLGGLRARLAVSALQKVTQATPVDFAIHGWAMPGDEGGMGSRAGGGVLVSLAVEAGRLRSWRQRPCGRAVADPLVAATPAAWVPFAQRNAELAAQLDRARSRSAK